MIHIDRAQLDEMDKRIEPNRRWFRRSSDAKDLAVSEREDHEFDSDIYGHQQVRMALEKLFHEKCAYCESPLSRQDLNVEHYRPKGRIQEAPGHPGYYWLGYDWHNLLPSCTKCNQKRIDKPTWDDPTTGSAKGKADHFPLANERGRVKSPEGDLSRETPLILNPCIENPSTHMTFGILGDAIGYDEKGNNTIEFCHLNEKRLKKQRSKRINAVIPFLVHEQNLVSRGDHIEAANIRKMIEDAFSRDECNFAGAVRAVLGDPTRFGIEDA